MKMKKVLAIGLSTAMIMSVTPGMVNAANLDADVAVEEFSDDLDAEETVVLEEPEVEEDDSDQVIGVELQDEEVNELPTENQEVNDDVALFSDGEENASAVGDGTIADNIQWKLEDSNEDGLEDTLIISGNGDMPDYESYDAEPWYAYRKTITHLVIEDGISAVSFPTI